MNQKEVPIHVPRATTLPSVLPPGLLPANDREKVRWWAPILAVGTLRKVVRASRIIVFPPRPQ